MAKLWAVVEETKTTITICRLGGMENSEVGPWHMLAIFDEKRKATRAVGKFRKAGFRKAKAIPVRLEPMD